jgi:hypothetical protein
VLDTHVVPRLGDFAGVPRHELYTTRKSDAGALGHIVSAIVRAMPRVLTTAWPSEAQVSAEELDELALLRGPPAGKGGAEAGERVASPSGQSTPRGGAEVEGAEVEQPLLVVPPDKGATHCIAGGGMFTSYLSLIQGPLQRTFAFSVPSDEALEALAAHAPICEVGCGTGYWGALLRARGVECALFDVAPPPPRGSDQTSTNDFHSGHCFTDVATGGPEEAARHPNHTLLLSWPFSQALERDAIPADGEPWDALTLRNYSGSVVAHIGELGNSEIGLTTTSEAFVTALRDSFELVTTVPLASWPLSHDALTIWRRRPPSGPPHEDEQSDHDVVALGPVEEPDRGF